jgi:hypothetical protein
MAPAYGNMLSAFPELVKKYEVFNMDPRIGAGYGERYNKRAVTGYWSWRKAREMGIEGDVRTKNDRATFWEQHDYRTGESLIEQGDYAEVKGHVYVFVEDDNFGAEGGFTRWTVQRVAGNTGQQTTNTKVDEAIRNDYA